jgi:hypothetical protein
MSRVLDQLAARIERELRPAYKVKTGRKYGLVKKKFSRMDEAIHQTALKLILGKRLEIRGKSGMIVYAGQSRESRADPFWYEYPGGRTYKRDAFEVIRAILPHVGIEGLEKAKVFEN